MNFPIITPEYLKPGDKIRIISPSGNIDPETIIKAKSLIELWGFEVEISENAFAVDGRFAGTDMQRAKDLNDAFKDPTVKAILCSRGGYGIVRLFGMIDEDLIKANPKWLLGYSDVTALHQLLLKNGISSVHCQMTSAITKNPDSDSVKKIKDLITGNHYLIKTENKSPLNIIGEANARLCGGNLAVISGLRGTDYDFDYQNKILFIEDIGETPYKIDRFVQNLRIGNIFSAISGLIIGQFTDCGGDNSKEIIYNNIYQVVKQYNIPVCFDFPIGHVDNNLPVIQGASVYFAVSENDIKLQFKR